MVDRDRPSLSRRAAIAVIGSMGAGAVAAAPESLSELLTRKDRMQIACFIRYQIDPFQRDAFEQYAQAWRTIIPQCGGHLIGYFLPSEGTNDIGWGLIGFESLAAYEEYRVRLRADERSRANFQFAQSRKFVLREERTFVELVRGSFNIPAVT